MAQFLRIYNPGVCPVEAFTTLGASLSREVSQSADSWIIGQFGSGSKHAVAMCLRYMEDAGDGQATWKPFSPVVFCGRHKLTFFTEQQIVRDEVAEKIIHIIWVQHGGIDQATGKGTKRKEKTSMSIDSGVQDWKDFQMALREFVSNAFDMSFRQYCSQHPDSKVKSIATLSQELDPMPSWKRVQITIVDEKSVKAEPAGTCVYLPMNPVVSEFFQNKGRWFLQLSDSKAIKARSILTKAVRNLPRKVEDHDYNVPSGGVPKIKEVTLKSAVVYRKGVRVREFGEDNRYDWQDEPKESIFDYNLNDLRIDEARRADDHAIANACAGALAKADYQTLVIFFEKLKECQPRIEIKTRPIKQGELGAHCDGPHVGGDEPCPHCVIDDPVLVPFTSKYWEFDLNDYYLGIASKEDTQQAVWNVAFFFTFGENAVLTNSLLTGNVQSKGYDPVVATDNLINGLGKYGIPTYRTVLTDDDRAGRNVMEPLPIVLKVLDGLWQGLHKHKLLPEGTLVPVIKGFVVDADLAENASARKVHAYYKDNSIYVSNEYFGDYHGPDDGGVVKQERQAELPTLMLEQIGLHVTGRSTHDENYWKWFVKMAVIFLLDTKPSKLG